MANRSGDHSAEAVRAKVDAGILDDWLDAASPDELAAAFGVTPEDLAAAEAERRSPGEQPEPAMPPKARR